MFAIENNEMELTVTHQGYKNNLLQVGPVNARTLNQMIDKETRNISMVVNYIVICCTTACFGIVANVINIHIFVKQGFENTVNISLLGIAVSDLCTLVTVLWLGVCVNPLLQTDAVNFEEIEYLTAGWPHCLFARITCMITVYITIERCICVTMPLKVKNLITKPKTIATVVLIFISQLMTAIPTYYSAYIGWRFIPERNRTVLGLCRIENWKDVELLSFVLQPVMQGSSFILLSVVTLILIVNIRRKTKWRATIISGKQSETSSIRDARMVKMIITIALILIVCFIPGMIGFLGMSIEPGYNIGGKYDPIFLVTFSVAFVCQTSNSSVNIFVYYSMSSSYRSIFDETFAGCRKRLFLRNRLYRNIPRQQKAVKAIEPSVMMKPV